MKKKLIPIVLGALLAIACVLTACNNGGKSSIVKQVVIEDVNLSENEIDNTVTDVNFYTTLGTLPTLYAGLDMFSKNEISYVWFERTGTLLTDKLPENAEMITETGDYSAKIMNAIINKVNYASKKYPNAKIHFYCDDLRVQFIPLCFNLLGIDNFDVTLLSDGTATYNNFNSLYASAGNISTWNKAIEEFDKVIDKCSEGDAKIVDINSNSQYSNAMYVYAQRENVEYWMQYPEFLKSADEKITEEMAKVNFVKKLPEDMYSALTAEQQTAFLAAVNLDKASFDENYFNETNGKPYLIITGNNSLDGKLGEEGFDSVINQIIDTYGAQYNLLFKPHPAAVPSEENGKLAYFTEKGIKVLPGRLPMEILLWVYSDVKLGGFNSTLYISAPQGNTLFFIASGKEALSQPLQLLFDDLFADAVFIQP